MPRDDDAVLRKQALIHGKIPQRFLKLLLLDAGLDRKYKLSARDFPRTP